jgi:hypothetical protein
MTVPKVFQRLTSALDQAGVAYMLTGSFASAYYGAPRTTQDIDLVIEVTPGRLQTFVGMLPSDEYYVDLEAALEALERQSLFNVVDLTTGWKIDLIIRKSRAFSEEEFGRRKLIHLHDTAIYVASAEDVVVSKLEWGKLGQSQRQIEDAASILRMRWDSLDRAYVEKWVSELGLTEEWNVARRKAGINDIAG